ncbi:MAG: hypothetical protein MR383_11565 [Lachnospiraceae bacterium]|nr:hypothetical protein [Lachnospiraceae bacterium]MDD7026883.1 hypothetical protein [Lachnospiraceae bacterium]MDY5701509.1 hypothetical protein [Lachnospiraceae bacterium]
MNIQKQKKWFLATLSGTAGILFLILVAMVVIDPYFHYHGAIAGVSYRLYSERYMNYGIAKNFEYDALITGSSMNQNFKTTLMDDLYGTKSIKIAFSGAGFQEIAATIDAALSSGNEVKYVLWGLDYNGLNREYDWQGYDEYPEYLYDTNPLNDVSYVWNKTILFEGLFTDLLMTLQGEESTTFDEYSSWEAGRGWESISQTYQRSDEILPMETVTEGTKERVRKNITENIVNLVNKYPDTQFLLFYTPYSALYWESIYRDGTLEKQLELEAIATELLLECDNVKLYSFARETQITGEVNLYRDKEHYVAEINDCIMTWIARDYGRLTKENYQELIRWEYDYYMNYDYDRLYE